MSKEDTNGTAPSIERIYTATVSAPTNIACIKYWGKSSIPLNTPINDSVSVTLDQSDLRAVTTASASPSFDRDRLWLNGDEDVNCSTNVRFRACVDELKSLATTNDSASSDEWRRWHVHVSSYNTFPTAAGLASSAAGYAALVHALATLYSARETYPGQFTAIARKGSGSACRSLHGGFVAWRAGSDLSDGSDSIAEQICDERHWPDIRALVLVISDEKKTTSSTGGMRRSVATSSLLAHRASHVVPGRMREIEAAFKDRDFGRFGELTMRDSNQFHACCLDTFPPVFYMNDVSRSVINMVHAYNDWAGETRAAYTFDAGPNAVLYTLEEYLVELTALVLRFYPPPATEDKGGDAGEFVSDAAVEGLAREHVLDVNLVAAVEGRIGVGRRAGEVKAVYCTRSGPGPRVLGEDEQECLIDTRTGLNAYQKG